MVAAAAEACWLSFLVVILLIAVAAALKPRLAAQASPEAAAGARGVKLHVGQRQVVVDNGVMQVAMLAPEGRITGVGYGGEPSNLLEYDAGQGDSGGYWDSVWNYPGSDLPGQYNTLDSTEFNVVSSSEDQVELSFRSTYSPSLHNSFRLNIDSTMSAITCFSYYFLI